MYSIESCHIPVILKKLANTGHGNNAYRSGRRALITYIKYIKLFKIILDIITKARSNKNMNIKISLLTLGSNGFVFCDMEFSSYLHGIWRKIIGHRIFIFF